MQNTQKMHIDLDEDGNLIGIEIWRAPQNAILSISRDIAGKLKLYLESQASISLPHLDLKCRWPELNL
ncbi:DUF2283 domain-containing protein [Candidatus Bathyarchaeota archaeon]|nr:DUF2283 domain-containing protein [Candidatus Bathyarchaeota archaeon]